MKQRIEKIGISLAVIMLLGCTYGAFVSFTGWAVPCSVYLITGLKCPGCGVTRMCLAIMDFDFKNAYQSNQMLFILLPVLFYLLGSYALGYIRSGRWYITKKQTLLTYICIGLMLGYGIYRNI